jgi:hypothetical protein
MFKNLFFIFLFLVSNLAFSEEVKLSCNMKVIKLYSTGSQEKLDMNETFEIVDLGNVRSITPLSANFNGVTTSSFEGKVSHDDYSSPNKWHLKEVATADDAYIETTIRIDRHSGKISYTGTFKNSKGSITTNADGDCKKIDTTKKKF